MKLEDHVLKSIQDFGQKNCESSLLHACFAIEATTRNLYKLSKAGKQSYKKCLREYYWLIEFFFGGGVDLVKTKFTHIKLDNGYGKIIQNPDLADIIYHVFRCSHAHAKEVPIEYELTKSEDGIAKWTIGPNSGVLMMPDRIIWSLLAVAVFCKSNFRCKTDGNFYLSWGSETLGIGIEKFFIKDSWGKEDDIKIFASKHKILKLSLKYP